MRHLRPALSLEGSGARLEQVGETQELSAMAVPKRRTSKSRKGHRRSHDGLEVPHLVRCSRCNAVIERHTICAECGYYKGKPVIAIDEGI